MGYACRSFGILPVNEAVGGSKTAHQIFGVFLASVASALAGNAQPACLVRPLRGRNKITHHARKAWLEWSPTLPHSEEVEMRNRLAIALLLAVVLALPAFAQQSGSTAQDQSTAQPATTQ